MKKICTALCMLFFVITGLTAQKLELIQKFPFDNYFAVAEKWDANEGSCPGPFAMLFVSDSKIFISFRPDYIVREYFFDNGLKNYKQFPMGYKNAIFSVYQRNYANGYFIGEFNYYDSMGKYERNKDKDIVIYNIKDKNSIVNPPYLSGGKLFANTSEGKIVYFEFDIEGKYSFHGTDETEKLLQEHSEEYGYHYDQRNEYHIFGDHTVNNDDGVYLWAIYNDLKYSNTDEFTGETLRSKSFLGTDLKGLSYYCVDRINYTIKNIPRENCWFVVIGILDPWHKQVTFRKIPTGEWVPMETNDGTGQRMGGFIKTVSPSGDIYMFDGNRQEQCYQLKRLRNDWWQELGMVDITVGQITTNHIPLRKEPSGTSEMDGYNYENDYVEVLETKGEWNRVHKLDGREGWIEKKYIVVE